MSQIARYRLTVGYTNAIAPYVGGVPYVDQFGDRVVNKILSGGTGALQFDRAFQDVQSLATSSITYDLSALPNGQAFAHGVGLILIVGTPEGSGGTGTVGPAASLGWTNGLGGPIPLCPGAVIPLLWPDAGAPAVAAGSNCKITVATTGTLQFYLALLGTSV